MNDVITRCGVLTPDGDIDLNIGSGNDLLPDSTKPLPESMFSCRPTKAFCGNHLRAMQQEVIMNFIRQQVFKSAIQIYQSYYHISYRGQPVKGTTHQNSRVISYFIK